MPSGMYPETDAEYEASSDYDALVRSEVVQADATRMKAAGEWGKKVQKAKDEEAAAEAAVAKLWT